MDKGKLGKCFYKNGKKILKNKSPNLSSNRGIVSISSLTENTKKFSIANNDPAEKNPFNTLKVKTKPRIHLKDLRMNVRAGITGIWASASIVVIFAFITSIMVTPQKAKPTDTKRYAIYASRPLTLQSSTTSIYSKDSRAQKINEVYKMYKCPLEGLGDVMVYEADKNDIPWWLVAAVSFQESSCGKRTPKISGSETYNAWGWGVYGGMVFSFDNWVRGIETTSKYFSEKFYSKGITNTCEIMKTYTPPSNGSWCEGVNHFANLIQNYETPED